MKHSSGRPGKHDALQPYPQLSAALRGYPAYFVAKMLEGGMPAAAGVEALVRAGRPEVEEVRAALAAIRAAAVQFTAWQDAAMSEAGRPDVADPDLVASSQSEWLTTAQAADQLGVTERQVCRLIGSGALSARRAGWAWSVSRVSVALYRRPVA